MQQYAVTTLLGLAAAGYLQAAGTLMGPFSVIYFGMGLVAIPEASRALRKSPRHVVKFCLALGVGLSLLAGVCGGALLVLLPRGLGQLTIGSLWRPTYRLIPMMTASIVATCFIASAGIGLHALGVARRSLRMMVVRGAISVACAIAGSLLDGIVGAVTGLAFASTVAALLYWNDFFAAAREHRPEHADTGASVESMEASSPVVI